MKRLMPLVLVVGGVGLALWFVVRSQRPQPAAIAAPQVQPTTPPAATPPQPPVDGEEPIVYQFTDDATMREFAAVWQQRQKTLLRMAVLRAYWDNEQSGAAALNTRLETEYNLDPAGNYVLDGEQRALIERPAPAAAPETPAVEGQPVETPPSAEGEGQVVHTFATDEEMQQFATAWQQRQGSGVRLAVLKSFWDEENAELTKLNETLTATYHLDVTKNYTLDAARRVIIEAPATAAPAPAAEALPNQPAEQPATPETRGTLP